MKMKRLTSNEIKELKQLKREINDSYEAAETLVKSSKDKARQALAEALTCGKALLRVKATVGFGGFEKWVKDNCKGIVASTARRYMSLAKRAHGSDLLTTSIGLRQAYIALGIVQEDEPETHETNGATMNESTDGGSMSEGQHPMSVLTNRIAKANGHKPIIATSPSITAEDMLSRPRYLVGDLLSYMNNIIDNKKVTLTDLEGATLKPIAAWFNEQRAAKKK
jgi:hypothetical protein